MNYYNQIKEELINNEINKKVKDYSKNKSDLTTYYNVGKLLIEAQGGETRAKYGNQLIKEYSIRLTKEIGKGYSVTSLKYMRQFYLYQKGQQVVDLLPWGHYTILMSLSDIDKINYYVKLSIKNNLSRNELRKRIRLKEYERLPKETKEKISKKEELSLIDEVKDPIVINSKNINIDQIKEKILKKLILDDISSFLKQLGRGYSFIDSEYKILIGNSYNYIDILLYNVIYHSYIVVELKVTKLKKEHIGQVLVYKNYIDKNIKLINDNETIGLIIVKENNKYVVKYSTDNRIKVIEYELV